MSPITFRAALLRECRYSVCMRCASAASKWGPRRTLCGGQAAERSGLCGPGLGRVADRLRASGRTAAINSVHAALNSSHVRSWLNLVSHSFWNWWTSSRAASGGSFGADGNSEPDWQLRARLAVRVVVSFGVCQALSWCLEVRCGWLGRRVRSGRRSS